MAGIRKLQTEFYGKRWLFALGGSIVTLVFTIMAMMGPLMLLGQVKNDFGKPFPPIAGVIVSAIAALLGILTWILWKKFLARGRPLIRICRDGVEVRVIAASALNDDWTMPSRPVLLWRIITGSGYGNRVGWISWDLLKSVTVVGGSEKKLVFEGPVAVPTALNGDELTARIGEHLAFKDSALKNRLQTVADTILSYKDSPESRQTLPSLFG
jgi:hypothetical protein